MGTVLGFLRYAWKAVLAAVGLAAVLLTAMSEAWGNDAPGWVPVALAVATTLAVFFKANAPKPGAAVDAD